MAQWVEAWRIEKEIFAPTSRTGEGARIAGGRWNSPGIAAVYCAETLALAIVEILVHASTPEERADPRVWFHLRLRKDECDNLRGRRLAKGWNSPMIHPETVAIGDAWLRANKGIALRVPSAVVPGAWNYVLNPAHPHFRKNVHWSKSTALQLDPRLVG